MTTNDVTNPGTCDPSRQCFPPPPSPPSTPSTSPSNCHTGESQFPATQPATSAAVAGLGLPANVDVAGTSHVRYSPPPAAAGTASPATEHNGDSGRPGGGLAATVYIR